MATPLNPVTLSPEQIEALNSRFADTRHDINNHLSLIVAAVELIKRKPESVERMAANIAAQPDKIMKDMRAFTEAFEQALGITRE